MLVFRKAKRMRWAKPGLCALPLAGMIIVSTSTLADGGRKLLVHHYDGTTEIAEYRTWHDCEFVRARLVGNHPYDIEAAHLDDEVKTAECVP
jgi:hypothetical protein